MAISSRDRILGGLWGNVVGDALGVPVEFLSREAVRAIPVTEMRGNGSHRQPAGTWSDDSSLTLCTIESLVRQTFDVADMGSRFLSWYRDATWTARGSVFDVGVTTADSLNRMHRGVRAEVAGSDDLYSNGNGSLMRMLPIAIRFANEPVSLLLKRVHTVSAITHRHPRSQMACGWFTLLVRQRLDGRTPDEAIQNSRGQFREMYESDPWWGLEYHHFSLLLNGNLAERPETHIESGGYVVETLAASFWCLLTTKSFEECVLKGVNLGGDTDTTGCVAGGLAGTYYGVDSVPAHWREGVARHKELSALFERFANLAAVSD